MARHDTVLISFLFGAQRIENIPFPSAVRLVERYLDAEQTELVTLITQVNEDHWFASFYSDLLGGASPPTDGDWSAPRIALGRARNLYDCGGMDSLAIRELQAGVRGFNDIHKAFYDYRSALGRGGARAIVVLEITGMVAGAVFSAGVGTIAGVSLLGGSLASAGLTLAEQVAANQSMVSFGLQKEYDVAEIIMQTSASFISSVISGKLSEYFASALVRRFILKMYNKAIPGQYLLFSEIVYWAKTTGVALPLKVGTAKEFMIGFVASFGADRLLGVVTGVAHACQGEWISMREFLDRVAKNVSDKVGDSVFLKSDIGDAVR